MGARYVLWFVAEYIGGNRTEELGMRCGGLSGPSALTTLSATWSILTSSCSKLILPKVPHGCNVVVDGESLEMWKLLLVTRWCLEESEAGTVESVAFQIRRVEEDVVDEGQI